MSKILRTDSYAYASARPRPRTCDYLCTSELEVAFSVPVPTLVTFFSIMIFAVYKLLREIIRSDKCVLHLCCVNWHIRTRVNCDWFELFEGY